jgi:hypothetical protein
MLVFPADELWVPATGDDEVVTDGGWFGPYQLSDAFPAQPEPVHQNPFRVRCAPQPLVHDGSHLACHGRSTAESSRSPAEPCWPAVLNARGWTIINQHFVASIVHDTDVIASFSLRIDKYQGLAARIPAIDNNIRV